MNDLINIKHKKINVIFSISILITIFNLIEIENRDRKKFIESFFSKFIMQVCYFCCICEFLVHFLKKKDSINFFLSLFSISIKLKIVINIDIEKITLIFLCLMFIKSFTVTSTKFACRS